MLVGGQKSQYFPVSLHAVKLMYTATFQWGLKVATHFCVVVHQFFISDQTDTTGSGSDIARWKVRLLLGADCF